MFEIKIDLKSRVCSSFWTKMIAKFIKKHAEVLNSRSVSAELSADLKQPKAVDDTV